MFTEIREGWSFIFLNPVVRAVNVGLATGLIGGGMLVPLGPAFAVVVLDAGPSAFGVFITAMGLGVALGVVGVSVLQRRLNKARVFTISVLLAGVCLFIAASMSELWAVALWVGAMGVCAGSVYVIGFTLLHENVSDELRGRVFSSLYTLVRLCVLVAFAVGPFLAEVLGRISSKAFDQTLEIFGVEVFIPGVRLTLWLASVIMVVAGVLAALSLPRRAPARGACARRRSHDDGMTGRFIALEGGEGCGKSTQAARLAARLDAVLTCEPGATAIGAAIRGLLLDPDTGSLDDRAEALLYVADRAQHTAEVVRPALDAGRDVVSDRSAHSSLAYQGFGRGLAVDDLRWLSTWATGDTWPDLVILLDVPPALAAERVGKTPDRIEAAGAAFHDRVARGFMTLAAGDPDRWAVIDGTGAPDEVEVAIAQAIMARWPDR